MKSNVLPNKLNDKRNETFHFNYNISQRNILIEDLPREKIIRNDISSLSDTELLATLLNTGTKNKSALDLAHDILAQSSYSLSELGKVNINQLKKIKGIGDAKAAAVLSAMEIGRRRQAGFMHRRKIIRIGQEAALYFKPLLGDQSYESFHVLFLNCAYMVIANKCIAKGGISYCAADIKLILREAVELSASQLILCHNHPSGSLSASATDISFAKRIVSAGKLLEIEIVDHIIVSKYGYISFREDNICNLR